MKKPYRIVHWLMVNRRVVLLFCFFSLSLTTLFAQKTWVGTSGSDWNTPANWNPASVPLATDDVIISTGTPSQPTIGAAALAKSIEIQAGASLSITSAGSLSVVGSKILESPFTFSFSNKGTVTNNGTLILLNTGSSANFGLVNEATFTNNVGSTLSIDNTSYISVWNRLVVGTTAVFTNAGSLSIGQAAGSSGSTAGIFNEADFQNNGGTILIDRIGSACIQNLPNSSFVNSATITIGKTSLSGSVGIYNFASFKNTATGTIGLDRTSTAIYNLIQFVSGQTSSPSSFTNEGKINIGQNATINSLGIHNLSDNGAVVTFINKAGAEIVIDRSSTAIQNENKNSTATTSSFTNEGKINIGQNATVNSLAIYNIASTNSSIAFTNSANAEIVIDRSVVGIQNDRRSSLDNAGTIKVGTTVGEMSYGSGILNRHILTNQATGLIQIERINSNSGLHHAEGTFTNSGTLTIGLSASVSGSYATITSSGTIVNETGAIILIDNCKTSGFQQTSNGALTNRGLIDIGKNVRGGTHGFYSDGFVDNQATGVINVDHVNGNSQSDYSHGIYATTKPFTNAGTITIGSSASAGTTALFTYSPFTNTGQISIDHTVINSGYSFFGLRNEGNPFTNTGKITIGVSSSIGEWGLWNQSTFNNNAGGEITINRSSKTGLRNQNGTFRNAGKLNVGNTAAVGTWGIWNQGAFVNSNELTVDNATETGLRHNPTYSGAPSSFTNTGSFKLGSIASIGEWGFWNEAAFINAGGSMSVERANQIGMVNANNTFTNAASLTISAQTSTSAIGLLNEPLATFSNSACAALTLFDNLSNVGAFTNEGFFTLNTADPHSNTALTNNGVIDYPQGNLIPGVTNNDLIIAPISTTYGVGVAPALQIGGSNSFSVGTTWYKDLGLTTIAGTYSPNTFTSNLTAIGAYPLYIPISDLANGCVKTMAISTTHVGIKPTLTLGSIPTIAVGATSFIVPYTNTTGSPTLYSLSGPGIIGVTDAALPSSPITVSLTSGASGCAISFSLTVKSALGFISDNIAGSATIGSAVVGQAQVVSISDVGVLGPGNCAVSLSATATGNNFVFTNSTGYVFSYVYRQGGTYSIKIPAITKPGTYTFNVSYGNCPPITQVTQTVVVTGTACPE